MVVSHYGGLFYFLRDVVCVFPLQWKVLYILPAMAADFEVHFIWRPGALTMEVSSCLVRYGGCSAYLVRRYHPMYFHGSVLGFWAAVVDGFLCLSLRCG